MNFVGIDLHKKTITLCVVTQEREVLKRKTLYCAEPERIVEYFEALGAFQAVIEATASYEWLWQLLEPRADRLVLAHPKKLRVIAESTRKTDRIDAQVLAEFLALDMIPTAYRPTPSQRAHRQLTRQRCYLRRRTAAVKVKIRRIIDDYNADRKSLFTAEGRKYLKGLKLSPAARFTVDQLLGELAFHAQQLRAMDRELRQFGAQAPVAEAEARAVLQTVPGLGPVTINVVISEIADVRRFGSAKQVAAYAGLAPAYRESAGKRKDLGISKEGSRLLRWVLVQAAWRLVRRSPKWKQRFEALAHRRGKKKGIVAIARRLLGTLVAVWRSGQAYRHVA